MRRSMDSPSLISSLPTDVLTTLFSRTFDGIAISEGGIVIYVNAELATMLGYRPEEMIGKPAATFSVPGPDAQVVRDSQPSNQEGTYIARGYNKSGEIVHAEIRSLPYFWNGRLLRLSAFRNITEVVKAENSLRASELHFRTLVESAEQGIWQIDAEFNTVFVNAKMAGYLQYTPEEMIGRSLFVFVPPYLHEALRVNLAARRAGKREVVESRYFRKDGTIASMVNSVAPINGPAGEFLGALGFMTDITAQRAAEAKLAELRGRMLFSSQASLLGEIANGIAHEINNPLLVIRSYADVLREDVVSGRSREQLLDSLNHIEATVSRISQIVRSLAVYTRASNPEPFHKTSVASLVNDSVGLCEVHLKRAAISLIREPIASDLSLDCRFVPVSQILLNLLNNAADAVEGQPEKWIRIGVDERDGDVMIWVEDSGPGVPELDRARIMDAFFTTKPPNRGTGLGLSISRKFAESHGGSLILDTASKFTRFVLRLPKRQPSKRARPSIDAVASVRIPASLGSDLSTFC